MSISAQLSYYADRLILQYREKPKARNTIAIFGLALMAEGLAQQIIPAFSLETAVGAQLDVIGKYVGLSRHIGLPAPQPYFEFSDPTVPFVSDMGFHDSTDPSVNGQVVWYYSTYFGTQNTDLSDSAYRFMLKWKILTNMSDGTLEDIVDQIHAVLPEYLEVIDNADMTMEYVVTGILPVDPAVLFDYLPRPMGVEITLTTFTVALSTNAVSKTNYSPASRTVTSPTVTVTPSGGVGPYTYLWTKLEQSGSDAAPEAVDATSDTTAFSAYIAGGVPPARTNVSLWRCAVTDSRGIISYTEPVTVTLTYDAAP